MASSLKEYLKRYESTQDETETKTKTKKKKKKVKDMTGVLVVDEDPVWQKSVNLEEDEGDSPDEEKPQINEDIEVKRMKRLEMLRAIRGYDAISEDGSGWVSLSSKRANVMNQESDGREETDLSSPRQQRKRHHTPSPEPYKKSSDLSPPRRRSRRNDTPPLEDELMPSPDSSPPWQQRRRYDSPSPGSGVKRAVAGGPDNSPPRRPQNQSPLAGSAFPPRRGGKPDEFPRSDHSPPRNKRKDVDLSPPRKNVRQSFQASDVSADLSPPRKNRRESSGRAPAKEQHKTGLISGREIREEIAKSKKDDLMRFKEMDPNISGRDAEPVYRDKVKGVRISKDDFLKSRKKVEDKPKEVKLEWGKGLAQQREAEARIQELEVEKDKPFARTRDDPELEDMLKERLRWGDPMAHLVKKKHLVLKDLGDNEKMKESGFVIPQDIPSHSWLKRGLDAAPNRYGIRPGRHWDGVDRSTGFEKSLFKRKNEKQATESEAYLWSVADM